MSAAGRGSYPKAWPRAFYGDELTQCQWAKPSAPPLPRQVLFDGEMQDVMKLVLEAASGIALHERWFVTPFNCGDHTCINPHHWRAVRYSTSTSPELPAHPGLIQLPGDVLEQIERILAVRRDADEPTRIIHRSHPHFMYSQIETARRMFKARTKPVTSLDSNI